jgi:hypothetical protein
VLSSSEEGAGQGGNKRRACPRAKPLTRRRDGAAVQARTREQSPARVRVPSQPKAPRFFRRCGPSRGRIRGESRPGRESAGSSRPDEDSNRRPGCPGHHEEGTRDLVKSVRLAFARVFRPVTCSFRASGTRRAKAGACKSRFAGPRCGNASAAANATGIGWCQRVAGRKPHSRARIDGSSGVLARRIRLQKSANDVEVQRSVSPAGCGARGQEPSSRGLRKESRGSAKASITSTAVAKPQSWGRPEPDAREGVAGQRFSSDGRHLGSFIGTFVHAGVSRAV